MALFLTENLNNGSILGIWKKEEELDFLLSKVAIKEHESENYQRINNLGRKKEWLTTRLLLKHLVGDKKTIHYAENGKPSIKNSPYRISISHSKDFVAILLSAALEPGIDIEHIAERVLKVKHKFLTNEEVLWCKQLEQHTICWSAKEAIFKTIGQNVDFKDINIQEFDIKDELLVAHIEKYKRHFTIYFRILENNVLTFTLPKIICNS